MVYFILASSATIGSCGDFCDTGSMYFFMAHPLFDVLEVYEQVIDRFQAPKHIHRHLFDQHVGRGGTPPKSEIYMQIHWAGHGSHLILRTEAATVMAFKCL